MQKTLRACTSLVFWLALTATAPAQDSLDPGYKTPDLNSAVIQGRVTQPSGFAAESYFRITLRNQQSTLQTTFTNKHGEFQIRNLSEGVYFVQAEESDGIFEPVVRKVELGRGLMVDITLELRERKGIAGSKFSARVVSAAELRQSVPAAAKKEYELGLKLVSKGDFQQAAGRFQQALTIYPEYLAARNDLGAQYLKLKQLDEAEKHFQIVLQEDPKNFNAKFNMGLVRIERHDYLTAISELNQAIAIDSTRPVAILWLGIALLDSGDVVTAERELTKSLIMGGSECVAAHYHLARIYFSRGDVTEAARSVRVYLESAPKGEFVKDAQELEKKLAKKN